MTGRAALMRISVVFVAVIALGWILHAWLARSYLTLIAEIMIVTGGIYVALCERLASLIPASQRWRLAGEDRGLVLRPNRLRVAAFITAVMSLLLGFFMLGLLQMLGGLAAPSRSTPTQLDRALDALIPIVGVVCDLLALIVAVFFLLTRGNTGSLVIAPDGVALWSRRTTKMPWGAVRAVSRGDGAAGPDTGDLVIDGEPQSLTLSMSLYPKDAAALADLVWFYWRNPGSRSELSDGRALARWEARDFPPGSGAPPG